MFQKDTPKLYEKKLKDKILSGDAVGSDWVFTPPELHERRLEAALTLYTRLVGGENSIVKFTALDFGCGLGTLYPYLKDKVSAYLGVDSNQALINICLDTHGFSDTHYFEVGEIGAPQYRWPVSGNWDVVFCLGVAAHLDTSEGKREANLREFARTLCQAANEAVIVEFQEKPHYAGSFASYTFAEVCEAFMQQPTANKVIRNPGDTVFTALFVLK